MKCIVCEAGPEQSLLVEYGDGKGPPQYICEQCLNEGMRYLENEDRFEPAPAPAAERLPERARRPREIKQELDRRVAGQERAKRALSVAFATHALRFENPDLPKANVLLVGPSGTGKTLLVKEAARVAGLPVAIADATSLTQAGYVGDDVESVLTRLLATAGGDLELAQRGVIFVDEVDKIARKGGENPSITRDVSGEGVQQALLKLVEGTVANVPFKEGRKHPGEETVQMKTDGILWIFAGAFEGLEMILEERKGRPGIGFGADAPEPDEALPEVTHEDLIRYGLIPEFMGRVPQLVRLDPLDGATLRRIVAEVENSYLERYRRIFDAYGVRLEMSEAFVDEVVRRSLKNHRRAGGRAPQAVLEPIVHELLFHLPDPEVSQIRLEPGHLDDPERALEEARSRDLAA